MPWNKLINGMEEIVGPPGRDGILLNTLRLAQIRGLIDSLGFKKLRSRDIADGFLSLLPSKNRRGKGVYYTPHRVVSYILDEVLPQPRISRNQVTDPWPQDYCCLEPACGSGYFLIEAFKRFREGYELAGFTPGQAVRKAITGRIAGVDIDEKALLVTLAGLVQECGSELEWVLESGEIILPLYQADFLDKRIDDHPSRLGKLLTRRSLSVVGNPPYISFYARKANELSKELRSYYKANYLMGKGRINTYCLFIERAFDLLGPSGVLGFIVPNTVLIMKSYEPLRQHLIEEGWLRSIVDLSLKVFPEVEVPTCVLTVEKKDKRALPFPRAVSSGFWESARTEGPGNLEERKQEDFLKLPYTMFNIHIRKPDRVILDAIEKISKPLGEYFEVRDGINPANMTARLLVQTSEDLDRPFRKVLRGKDIGSYQLNWDQFWVRYDPGFVNKDEGEYCFLREERIFTERPKILTRQTADRIVATLDEDGYYAMNTLHVTLPLNGFMDLKSLLALYNSKLLNYYYRIVFPDTERVFPQVKTVNVEKLPLAKLNGESVELGSLVDGLMDLDGTDPEYFRKREKLLDEIDDVVYRLYRLTPSQSAHISKSSVAINQ